jgi:hypothetical protein
MKRIQMGGLALMAVVAFGVLSTASASAHVFLWSGATGVKELLVGEGKQIFAPKAGGGTVVCNTLNMSGTIVNKEALFDTLSGEYKNCNALGLEATVSPVEYEFSADETVKVNDIIISIPTIPCKVLVLPGQVLSRIRYLKDPLNANAELDHAEVTNIHSILTEGGGACEELLGGKLSATGTYKGLALVFADGAGTLSWE